MASENDLVLTKSPSGRTYNYNRSGCPTNEYVERKLAEFYETDDGSPDGLDAYLLSSGMHAISSAIYTGIEQLRREWRKGKDYLDVDYPVINICYSGEMYCDTERTIKYIEKIHKCPIKLVKIGFNGCYDAIVDEWKVKACPRDIKYNIFVIESSSNPNGNLFPTKLLSRFREYSLGTFVIMDNTWLTHLGFNPLMKMEENCQTDMVALSLTKYYTGGKIIAGAVISNKETIKITRYEHGCTMGFHISAAVSKIIMTGLDTFDQRMKSSQLKLGVVINAINQKTPHFYSIRRAIVKKENGESEFEAPVFMIYYTGISKNSIMKQTKKAIDVNFKTSYGGPDHRINPWIVINYDTVGIRISVGWRDDTTRLINFLNTI